ncbi:chemotaxis protein CheD [Natrialbaceae archaeon A-gly3]
MTDNNDNDGDGDDTDVDILVFGDEDDTEEDTEPVAVGIAEYAVTDQGQPLSTSGLGSCVAVVVHDDDAGVSGLLHCMLPEAAESLGRDDAEAKFADTGIETMLESFRASGGDPVRSWAKMAGGASMIEFSSSDRSIGERNADAARTALEAHGVSLEGADIGGQSGRAVVFDPATGELTVKSPTGEGKDI